MTINHYFSEQPSQKCQISTISFDLFERKYELYTGSSVFSVKRLDPGSQTLIEAIEIPTGLQNFLDLGCGYGVIGIVLQTRFPQILMHYADINPNAIMCTKKNLKKYGLTAQTYTCDGFSGVSKTFDGISLNPPFSAGRETCLRLIIESYEHLNQNGKLYVVARKSKGGAFLGEYLEEQFGNVVKIRKKRGFTVYMSLKKE